MAVWCASDIIDESVIMKISTDVFRIRTFMEQKLLLRPKKKIIIHFIKKISSANKQLKYRQRNGIFHVHGKIMQINRNDRTFLAV